MKGHDFEPRRKLPPDVKEQCVKRRNDREGNDFSRAEKRCKLNPALAAEVGRGGRNIEPVTPLAILN